MEHPLPPFNEWGYLPSGVWLCSMANVEQRFSNTMRRQNLLSGMNEFVDMAKRHGGLRLLIGGSFVTDKPEPNDLDIILMVPSDGDIAISEMLLERCIELGIHCFIVREDDREELADWVHFFGHDRGGIPKGLVEVRL